MNKFSYNVTSQTTDIIDKITETVLYFKLLSEKNRLSILLTLLPGSHCVTEIQVKTQLSQSLVSHHLRDLKDAGLVSSNKAGKWVYYALSPKGKSLLITLETL